jgi:hypothetical protein
VPERGNHLSSKGPAAALAALPPALRAQTAALVVRHDQGVLQLTAIPGGGPPAAGEVRLGRLEQVGQKGAAALAVLDQLLPRRRHGALRRRPRARIARHPMIERPRPVR